MTKLHVFSDVRNAVSLLVELGQIVTVEPACKGHG